MVQVIRFMKFTGTKRDSWVFVPLILHALGLIEHGGRTQTMAGSQWTKWVDGYKADFASREIKTDEDLWAKAMQTQLYLETLEILQRLHPKWERELRRHAITAPYSLVDCVTCLDRGLSQLISR